MREVQRKCVAPEFTTDNAIALSELTTWLDRAERIRKQQRHDKNKLYALHAPERERISKSKARKACVTIKQVVADLGFRGKAVDADNPRAQIIHRGRYKSLSEQAWGWLKRRRALEPAIEHLKSDHRLDRCWLKGALGDALHAIGCAASYNLRWLLRAIVRPGTRPAFLRLL